jgi:hypothetical protein
MKTMELPRLPVPSGSRIVQHFAADHILDIRADVRQKLVGAGIRMRVSPGSRVAITAGSRGMGGVVEALGGIADAVKEAGAEPFLIPAMGSHGGATPEGQVEILKRLGITEESVGAPIRATMDTVVLDQAESGAKAHLDAFANEADGIIVLGRIKTHPESNEGLAAGLCKMTTIGLGKQQGAQEAHSHGLWSSVRTVPQITLARAKVLFGVGVVENAYRQPVVIEVVPGNYEAFLETDRRLLTVAKAHLGTIPYENLDVLIVDEIGKNISGTGMDTNVIGHWRSSGKGSHTPDFKRVVALSLTSPSLGNGLGIGMADFTTKRFIQEFNPEITYVNLLTATEPDSWNSQEGLVPIALPSDREAIEVALYSALAFEKPRVCRITNTDSLGELWVSEALLEEAEHNGRLSVDSQLEALNFDTHGNLF